MTENEKMANVPYFVHEGMVARMQRMYCITVAALIVALAVAVISLVVNDGKWRQYCKDMETRYHQTGEVQDAGVYKQSDEGTD